MVDMITNHSNIILMGDFNIPVGDMDDAEAMTFLDTIEILGLEQWVDEPTHRSDNILDLVVSGAEDKTNQSDVPLEASFQITKLYILP